MAGEHLCNHTALLSRRLADDANDFRVWHPADDSQLTEVLVEGHEYATLRVGTCQDLGVAGIHGPIARPDYVVAKGEQLVTSGSTRSAHEAAHIDEARLDVLSLKPRVAPEDRFVAVSGREHAEHVLDREAITNP